MNVIWREMEGAYRGDQPSKIEEECGSFRYTISWPPLLILSLFSYSAYEKWKDQKELTCLAYPLSIQRERQENVLHASVLSLWINFCQLLLIRKLLFLRLVSIVDQDAIHTIGVNNLLIVYYHQILSLRNLKLRVIRILRPVLTN